MHSQKFHQKPFDEGTLTKLKIFELYAREWLPVFLAQESPQRSEIHLFDFFAGPGLDSAGKLGSPLLLLAQLKEYQNLPGWSRVHMNVHFSDASLSKIEELQANIDNHQFRLPTINFDIQALPFDKAIKLHAKILANPKAAKLVLIDQFGVDHVTQDVFRQLVNSPTCDFLFFISSSTLHRFRDHPAIKQKITRPDDHYQVHHAVLDYYRGFLPQATPYFLAPFSIKKGSNIYGLIFGSAHPLGMDKFLQVAWAKDAINGEADFDINRDNILPGEMLFAWDEFKPSKITAFERELEQFLRDGKLKDELDVVKLCFKHGVRRQQAENTLARLKKERVVELAFRTPQIDHWNTPRPIKVL